MRISDWSSDVCSSDLNRVRSSPCGGCEHVQGPVGSGGAGRGEHGGFRGRLHACRARWRPRDRAGRAQRGDADRKSVVEGKSVSVRVDLGGRRIIKKKTRKQRSATTYKVLSNTI